MTSPTTAALPIDMAPTAPAGPATKSAGKAVPAKPPKKCEVPGAVCDLCRAPIALGEDIWPINPPTSVPGGTAATAGDSTLVAQAAAGGRRAKGKYWWAHARPCAETHLGGVLAPPPCIRWTIGECEYGAACFYSHPERTALPAGAANGVAPQDSAGGGGGAPGNGGARRKKVLNSSNLAFELLNCLDAPCLVVEPQPALRLARSRSGLLRRDIFARNPLYAKYVDAAAYARRRAAGGSSPDHLRAFFDADFAAWIARGADGPESGGGGRSSSGGCTGEAEESDQAWLDGKLCEARAAAGTWAGFGHPAAPSPTEGAEDEGAEEAGADGDTAAPAVPPHELPVAAPPRMVTAAAEVRARFLRCSVLVGLHPDAATEPIVDFALAHRRPFAVVPCCVHAKAAPGRVDAQGRPVRTYEAFLDYLQAKSPRIRRAELAIGGRSTVLFVTSYSNEHGSSGL
eukprot:jgi/Tetstr1/462446/TSEL_007444.t1